MGERVIDPKFNINKTYRRVNIINPYRFGGSGPTPLDYEPETIALLSSVGWAHNENPSPHNGLTYRDVYEVVDKYFKSAKTDGWLSLMRAIYLFLGSDSDTHKWNALNPQNTDEAFRMTFYGITIHSASGVDFYGNNCASTNLNQSINLSLNNESFGIYSLSESTGSGRDMSCSISGSGGGSELISNFNGLIYGRSQNNSWINPNNNTSLGFFAVSRTGFNSSFVTKGGNNYPSSDPQTLFVNNNFVLGARMRQGSDADQHSNREYCYAFIGEGLTESQMTAHYNAVQQLQVDLGRQV